MKLKIKKRTVFLRGFTLTELLISISIMIILTTVAIAGSRFGREHYALLRSAHQLAQDLRRAEEMAVSSKEFEGEIPNGYGIHLERDNNSYILFADSGEHERKNLYDSGEEIEDPVGLEKKVEISGISGDSGDFSSLNIVFSPPNPDIFIGNSTATTTKVAITLSLESDPEDQKLVLVNEAGLIAVEIAAD